MASNKAIAIKTWDRWNGTEFPTQDAAVLYRLSRYPRPALSRRALFAVAMSEYAAAGRVGRSACKPALD
jgi:hypothetical protein